MSATRRSRARIQMSQVAVACGEYRLDAGALVILYRDVFVMMFFAGEETLASAEFRLRGIESVR